MTSISTRHVAAVCRRGALVVLTACACAIPAQAQDRLKAHFTISMTGVAFGEIVWLVDIGEQRYTTSAHGKASGVLSVLVNGEGSVITHGLVADGRLTPSNFISNIADDEGKTELRMTFADGVVKESMSRQPPPSADRVPITDADRRGVTDPLSAMLITTDGDALASKNCRRVMPIFDGRRRYDLALSFKRIDKIAIAPGYSGPVLVCGVVLHPIAGYRADSMLVKYVAERRDMELWFAPVAGTPVIAPVLVSMPTLIGTLEIRADRLDAIAPPPSPAGGVTAK